MVLASGTMAFQYYAQIWLIYDLTNSALLLGVLGVARGAGMLVFGMYGGILADRMDRRSLLIFIEVATLLLSAVLAVMAIAGNIELWQAFALIFLASGVQSADPPVRQALIPELVRREDIPNAVALTTAARMGAFAVFPVFAGFIIDAIEPGGAYAVSIVGNVIGIGVLLALRYRGRAVEARRESLLRSVGHGLAYARRDPTISWILAVMFVMGGLGFAIYMSLIGKWAGEELGLTAGEYGLLASFWGVGTLIVAYSLAFMGDFPHKGKAFVGGSLAFGLSFVLFSFTRSLPVAALAYVINGAAWTAASISATAMVQVIVPNEVRGRVMSLFALHMAFSQMNGATLGAVADRVGLDVLMPAATILCTAVVALLVLAVPNLRRLDRRLAQPELAMAPESKGA
jgi:MFS family permease